jgi:signal transduction histidine kinase
MIKNGVHGLDYKKLFESAPGLYLVLNPELHVLAVSDAYLQATLTSRSEIIGKHLFEIFPDNPGDPSADAIRNTRASLDRVLRTRQPDVMVVQRHDVRRPESEGCGFEVRYWSPVNSPVLNPDGSIAYIIHRVENVTDFILLKHHGKEQTELTEALRDQAMKIEADLYARSREVAETSLKLKHANEELARLNQRAHELDALKSRFFANVSHELRTPLTLILGPVERLLKRSGLDAQTRQDLLVMQRNARLLQRHVSDLLDISKLDSGHMRVHYSSIDLASLARRVASHFHVLAVDHHIQFSMQIPPSLPAEADVEKTERVLFNLLSNAFKFTPEGGAIRLALKERSDQVLITVQDTGPGIPESQREAIFERFSQGERGTARLQGGTGLGLAIVWEFVSLHSGHVSVSEAQDGGAVFHIEMPLAAPPGTHVDRTAAVPEGDASRQYPDGVRQTFSASSSDKKTTRAGDFRILVVEDNPDLNAFIAEALGQHYRVISAFNAEDGLQRAIENPPDLILADIMMPGMSGDRMVAEIRRRPALDDVPIVMLTAKADDDLRIKLLRHGVQDYIHKPFSMEELLARVDGLLVERQRTREELRASEKRLKASLAEKEVLLKEVHHRVKNNMQVISSLVDLQADEIEDADMRAILHDVRYRVHSMAMVHEKLYQSNDLAKLEFSDYVKTLLEYLWRSIGANSRVQLDLDLKPVFLSVNQAVPGGLILNELFSNALKHAFKGRDTGKLRVSLAEDEKGKVRLCVHDDGIGLPPQMDWKQPRSLGLRIVRRLARQLHAAMDVTSNNGTQITINFERPDL